jgi:CDP-diacylglycerol--serine O-phosphatidyltransferase
MLGYWNKSVYITYIGAFAAVMGFLFALKYNNVDYAFVGMIIADVCDMFDGKIARHLKNRKEIEKDFGVEIDSLADVICFIAIPALTLYFFGLREIYQMILLALYVVCGIIRLAYFNVAMSDKNKAIEYYQGVPVPLSVPIFGIVWLLLKFFNFDYILVYTILVPIVGLLHISKIRIKKFTGLWFYITITLIATAAIVLVLFVL